MGYELSIAGTGTRDTPSKITFINKFDQKCLRITVNNLSYYFWPKLGHILVKFYLPGPSIYWASTLSPERPGKSRVYCTRSHNQLRQVCAAKLSGVRCRVQQMCLSFASVIKVLKSLHLDTSLVSLIFCFTEWNQPNEV